MSASASRLRLAPLAVLAAWLGVALAYFALYFEAAPLLDHYLFRQTQTASAARELLRGGPLFAYRLPLFGPPWSLPFEFPLYQAVVAQLSASTGIGLEQAGRLTSLAATVACLLSMWRLAVLFGLGTQATILVLVTFAFSPAVLYWSQAFMIETLALAACLLMCVCVAEFVERGRIWPLAWGVLFAACAALTKATTFALFALVVALYLALRLAESAWRDRAEPRVVFERAGTWSAYGLVLFLPAVLLLQAWVEFSDDVKAASPLTGWLRSAALSSWVYGDAGDFRLAMRYLVAPFRDNHASLFEQFFGAFSPAIAVLALAGLAYTARSQSVLKAVLLVGFLVGPAIFSNLFATHYYYWVANLVFATTLVALGLDGAIGLGSRVFASAGAEKLRSEIALTGAVLLLLVAGNLWTFHAFFLARTVAGMPSIQQVGDLVRQETRPDDVVVTFGFDWNPALQYYSDRPMVMARDPGKTMDHLVSIGLQPAAVLFCRDEYARSAERLRHRLFAATAWTDLGPAGPCRLFSPSAPPP